MKGYFILLILLVFAVPANGETVYKWVDKDGVVNFTDDFNHVPPPYRDRVEVEHYRTEGVAPVYTSNLPPQKTTESKADIYGRDETWWREEVHPWKKQLKEATENYERVQKEYMLQAQGLGSSNFGKMSLTQYQMLSARLEILDAEMRKYQDQMAEANEMLSKLFQEAKEVKADPAWLE